MVLTVPLGSLHKIILIASNHCAGQPSLDAKPAGRQNPEMGGWCKDWGLLEELAEVPWQIRNHHSPRERSRMGTKSGLDCGLESGMPFYRLFSIPDSHGFLPKHSLFTLLPVGAFSFFAGYAAIQGLRKRLLKPSFPGVIVSGEAQRAVQAFFGLD